MVGPPLTGFAQRTVLAGSFPNVPRFLVPWLMNPQALQPGTAMPNLGLTTTEAGHIASFLYTLGALKAEVYQERPTDTQYPWLAQAEAYRRDDSRRLTEAARIDDAYARIPVERAMDFLVAEPPQDR